MEEKSKKKIYMLIEELSERFNPHQWKQIKKCDPKSFQNSQKHIKTQLLSNQKLFHRYFTKFYNNHRKLSNWAALAIEKKAQISAYIFKELLSLDIKFYNEKIRQAFENKFKKVQNYQKTPDTKKIKNLQEEVFSDFFNNLLARNRIQHSDKPLNLKLYGKRNKSQCDDLPLDGHDFYIRTFNACNGWNYIFYNYEKHMKGLSEKCKYNEKIRNGQNRSNLEFRESNKMKLLSFQQQKISSNCCKIMPIKKILQSKGKNSYQELKRVSTSDVSKIVVVNHQGKPITYRVNRFKNIVN